MCLRGITVALRMQSDLAAGVLAIRPFSPPAVIIVPLVSPHPCTRPAFVSLLAELVTMPSVAQVWSSSCSWCYRCWLVMLLMFFAAFFTVCIIPVIILLFFLVLSLFILSICFIRVLFFLSAVALGIFFLLGPLLAIFMGL